MEVICEEVYKTSVISIDSYENRVLNGRISNPYLEEGISFRSTIEFIREMENLMRDLKFPQAYNERREFCTGPEPTPRDAALVAPAPKKGRLATFALRIMFRQNASWQGSLVWMNEKREECFRSVRELLLLIDSALDRIDT